MYTWMTTLTHALISILLHYFWLQQELVSFVIEVILQSERKKN